MGFVGRAPPPPPLLGFLSRALTFLTPYPLRLRYKRAVALFSLLDVSDFVRLVIWQVVKYENSNHGLLLLVQIHLLVLLTSHKSIFLRFHLNT